MRNVRDALRAARLYLVCGEQTDAFLERALRGGVDIVQLRLKDAGDETIVATARRYGAVCHAHDVPLILNDRPDLVTAAGADGVHVGQDDTAVAQARALIGPDRILGLSTHSPAQVDGAAAEPELDYIGVGPVHATPTKPGRPAVGLDLVRYAAAHAATPFFAIGGIDADNVAAVRAAGATRIAVVRAITDARDPEPAARALRCGSEAGVGAT
ncbi:MAG TPA: thiamine phosphate synthase [Solirubrobacteraceae bacterium]|nr:thiamine phosphate synthase [Solirubrobacteraceae bacterium]